MMPTDTKMEAIIANRLLTLDKQPLPLTFLTLMPLWFGELPPRVALTIVPTETKIDAKVDNTLLV